MHAPQRDRPRAVAMNLLNTAGLWAGGRTRRPGSLSGKGPAVGLGGITLAVGRLDPKVKAFAVAIGRFGNTAAIADDA